MTIDWSKFAGNVKRHSKEIGIGTEFPLTTREMHARYAPEGGPDEDEEASDRELSWNQVEEFSKPALDQPNDAQRSHMLWAMIKKMERDDQAYFYESMEGDYCDWTIHLADKLDRGLPLTAGDWQTFCFVETMVKNGDEELGAQEEAEVLLNNLRSYGVMEIAKKYENTETIFNTLLC